MPTQTSKLPAGLTVAQFYPSQVEQLVKGHKKNKSLLAVIWYDMDDNRDIRLLEVLRDFPASEKSSKFFSAEYDSTFSLMMLPGGKLIVELTSPEELKVAIEKKQSRLKPMKKAFAKNAARVLYSAPSLKPLVEALKRAK